MWSSLSTRLKGRADSEHVQVLIRIVIVALIALYFWLLQKVLPDESALIETTFTILTVSITASVMLLVWLLLSPAINPIRRVAGAVHDNVALTACLIACGELAAPCYGLYLWVTLGYGFRYGPAYMQVSQTLSVVGFAIVWMVSPFWRDNGLLTGSLMVTLLVVPSYALSLIRMLHAAKARAEENSRAKSDFVALVSHEFRTPLNGIIGHAQLLETTQLTEEQSLYLRNLQGSTAGLLDLVESVLDISRIESGEYMPQNTDIFLSELVLNCLTTVDVQARNRGLRLSAHIDPAIPEAIRLDVKAVREILLNLLGNAAKFTDAGSIELLVVGSHAEDANFRLTFSVRDSGIGIAQEHFTRVFERFTQVRSGSARPATGAGLGTTIARDLARRIGGDIWLESAPGRGSTFHLEIPVQGRLKPRTTPARPGQILLIGVSGTEADRLVADLGLLGYRSEVIETVTAALDRLRAGSTHHDWIVVAESVGKLAARQIASTLATTLPSSLENARLLALTGAWALQPALIQAGYRSSLPARFTPGTLAALLGEPLSPTRSRTAPASPPGASVDARTGAGPSALEHAKAMLAPMQFIRVLLVDDNQVNRLMMSTWLEKLGIEHQVASSGYEFLDMAADGSFDLFLIDHQMPDLDGIEALNLFRSAATGPIVPAVLISADVQQETVARALRAGFADVISKPLRLERLVPTLLQAFDPAGPDAKVRDHGGLQGSANARQTLERTPEASGDTLIDRTQIVAATALDPADAGAFVRRLRQAYAEDAKRVFARMRLALGASDWPSIWDAAHALKGNSANVGATVAALCCERLEAMTPEELRSDGSDRINELESVVTRSVEQIEIRHEGKP